MGGSEFDEFNKLVISKFEAVKLQAKQEKSSKKKKSSSYDHHKDTDSKNQIQNKGTLIADATVADQEIKFPIKN